MQSGAFWAQFWEMLQCVHWPRRVWMIFIVTYIPDWKNVVAQKYKPRTPFSARELTSPKDVGMYLTTQREIKLNDNSTFVNWC